MPEAALLSVSDKTGAVELARALHACGVTLYATGGTRAHLLEAGLPAAEVGELTGFPALFGGRVKTLHPKVFGAILYDRGNAEHEAQCERYAIPSLSTVVVNLYPFEATISRESTAFAEAIEQIDIGGVALMRAAAKNFEHVSVLSDPSQYAGFIAALPDIGLAARRKLAIAAFERTAEYDAAIAHYLEGERLPSDLPGSLTLTLPLATALRYGENPQSRAAFYLGRTQPFPQQLWGKALSYNNLLDLDATLRLLDRAPVPEAFAADAAPIRAVVVKHTVPCGVAEGEAVEDVVAAALHADAISAFGGIVAVDAALDEAGARVLSEFFLEIVTAPAFDDAALSVLKKKKNLRVLRYAAPMPERLSGELRLRSALGGVLAEERDPEGAREQWQVVAGEPSATQWRDLRLAWDVVRHVKSNGVVIVRDGQTRGICAGQTNRLSAVRIAAERAGEFARGSVCASDGFFPFADGLEAAIEAGCSAVIAPSGSIRDAEVVAAAKRAGISLVFSTHRYFLH